MLGILNISLCWVYLIVGIKWLWSHIFIRLVLISGSNECRFVTFFDSLYEDYVRHCSLCEVCFDIYVYVHIYIYILGMAVLLSLGDVFKQCQQTLEDRSWANSLNVMIENMSDAAVNVSATFVWCTALHCLLWIKFNLCSCLLTCLVLHVKMEVQIKMVHRLLSLCGFIGCVCVCVCVCHSCITDVIWAKLRMFITQDV
jgi:hypothetical protein